MKRAFQPKVLNRALSAAFGSPQRLAKPRRLLPSEELPPIDTSDLQLPKQHPFRSAVYRAWVRSHRCCAHGKGLDRGGVRCEGPVEAAHTATGGTGIKASDSTCAPACVRHHQHELHRLGFDEFIRIYGVDPREVAADLYDEWQRRQKK